MWKHLEGMKMITEEEWQVIYSALGCVSSESLHTDRDIDEPTVQTNCKFAHEQ